MVLSYFPRKESLNSTPKDGVQLYSDHIYQQLTLLFPGQEIIYAHFEESRKLRNMRGVTHLFGISANFDSLAQSLKPDISCLLSVNEHALMRRTVRDLRSKKGLSRGLDDPHDGYVSNLRETKYSDYVLGIGNWSVFQSFVEAGYPEDRLFITGYPYWQLTTSHKFTNKSKTILMFPGYICTRKGADYVVDIVQFLKISFPDFKLKLVGFLAYSDWKKVFRDLEGRFPDNFEFLECRVDFASQEWRDLANNVAFAIFPSHEEGLAGCALDVMNLGIPLIHSSKSGIEYQHELLAEVDFENNDWMKGLAKIIIGGSQLWKIIADAQRIASFHLSPRYSAVGRSLDRIVNGRIWPNIDTSQIPEYENSLSFINNPRLPYEYKLETNIKPDIHYRYMGNKLDSRNKLMLATLLLEKYTRFDSINLGLIENRGMSLIRTRHEVSDHASRQHIELIVREYIPASFWPSKKITYLRFRESVLTFFAKGNYRIKRGSKKIQQKIRLEINNLVNRFRD